jgi:hypothetical protein
MNSHGPLLIAADIGNVNTKLRRHGGAWELEPSLVRLTSGRQGFSFAGDEQAVRPIVYHSGPAGIERNVPYLVGRDAQRAGTTDVALIGSAELRVHAPALSCCRARSSPATSVPAIAEAGTRRTLPARREATVPPDLQLSWKHRTAIPCRRCGRPRTTASLSLTTLKTPATTSLPRGPALALTTPAERARIAQAIIAVCHCWA